VFLDLRALSLTEFEGVTQTQAAERLGISVSERATSADAAGELPLDLKSC
jgi:predicted DNA-binding protein (UPF0251 family)